MHFYPIAAYDDEAPPVSVRQQQLDGGTWLTVAEVGTYPCRIQLNIETESAGHGVAEMASFGSSLLEQVGLLVSAPSQLSDAAEDVAVMLSDRRAEIAGEL